MDHALPNLTLPSLRPFESIRMCLEIHHSLINLFLRVENKRSVLDDLLIEWETGDENCLNVSYDLKML